MNKIYTRLINREHPLPEEYIPSELVDIGLPFDSLPGEEKRLLEEAAARARALMDQGWSRKDAVRQVAQETGLPRNAVYDATLS